MPTQTIILHHDQENAQKSLEAAGTWSDIIENTRQSTGNPQHVSQMDGQARRRADLQIPQILVDDDISQPLIDVSFKNMFKCSNQYNFVN